MQRVERAVARLARSPSRSTDWLSPPAKPDCSRKSASLSSSDWRSTASASSGLNFCRCGSAWRASSCNNTAGRARVPSRQRRYIASVPVAANAAQSVPRRPPPPELPALLDRPDAVADRDVDADDGAGVARARADQQRVPRRPRRRGGSLPILLFSLPRRRDRRPRRTSCGSCASRSRCFSSRRGALVRSPATHRITIGWLLVLASSNGLIASFEIPARQSMIIELVGREDLPDAIALNSSGFNLARIVGPGIAAVVIARLGIAWCFGLNAVSYVAVLVGLVHDPPAAVRAARAAARRPWEGIAKGCATCATRRRSRALMTDRHRVLHPRRAGARADAGRRARHVRPRRRRLRTAALACSASADSIGALGLAAVGDRGLADAAADRRVDALAALLIAFSFTACRWLGYVAAARASASR